MRNALQCGHLADKNMFSLLENNYGSPLKSLKHTDVRLYLSQPVKNIFYQPKIVQRLFQIYIILRSANVYMRIFATADACGKIHTVLQLPTGPHRTWRQGVKVRNTLDS